MGVVTEYIINGVTLEEFITYMKLRHYSEVYIKDMANMFKRLAVNDPTINISKRSRWKANQVLHHIKSYKLHYKEVILQQVKA